MDFTLPSPRHQNLFKQVSEAQENPQANATLMKEFTQIVPILGTVLRFMPPEHVGLYQEFLSHLFKVDTIF